MVYLLKVFLQLLIHVLYLTFPKFFYSSYYSIFFIQNQGLTGRFIFLFPIKKYFRIGIAFVGENML